MPDYDVVVVGGGPGGYVAAIRASQLSLRTAIVEREHLGGVCLNWGCIPTKSLLRNAEVISLLRQGKTYGFSFDDTSLAISYEAAQERSRKVSSRLVKGVQFLMKKNNIAIYEGVGRLSSTTQVEIQPSGEKLNAKAIIIATGARARSIPGVQIDGKWVLNYRAALEMTDLPPRMIVVGAGAIGMEFAYLWNIYGSAVAVVEMLPNVLPLEDEDISKEVEKQFIKKGIRVLTSIRVEGVSLGKNGVEVSVRKEDVAETLQADKVLIATGIAPNSEDLGIERVGLATEHGFIKIDEHMATNVKGIYAIGDVTGKLALAHVASAQGIVAAEFIAGEESHSLRYQNMPRCTYCHPEVSSIGLTERQARVQGYDVKVGNFPFRANGKALALNDYEGFAKIVADGKYGELLGVHIVGPHVTELIAGPTGLISLESTVEELARTIHPHPTLSETVSEAALAVLGASIHI